MGTSYKPADIVLVAINTKDGPKTRPAVIVSSTEFNECRGDLVVAGIFGTKRNPFDVFVKGGELQRCGLRKDSYVRTGQLAMIDNTDIEKRVGQMPGALFRRVCDGIKQLLAT